MQKFLIHHNQDQKDENKIGLCIGIGYGKTLVLEGYDFFGHQLNLAFKLGEDIAEPGEILVTQEALAEAGPSMFMHDVRSATISGVTIPHGSIRYE